MEAQVAFIQKYRQLEATTKATDCWYLMDGVYPMHNVHLVTAGSRMASGCVCQATADTSDTTAWTSIVQDGKYLDEQTTDALIAQTVIALGDEVHQAHS